MFKKLKEKITEEVKISPQRFAEFTQSVSDRLQNSTTSDENFFSIAEDDLNTSTNIAGSNNHGFSSVTLVSPSQDARTRKNSTSSVASDVSFLPRYEAGSSYHLQSDLDISASELEDNASTASSQIGHLSKEQIYSAFQKAQMRYHKYRGRFTDLSRHYKDLERENAKMKAVLVETQDKAIRRVTELKEQCNLEQKAKAHLESALRDELDEKNYKIKSLQTKIDLMKSETIPNSLIEVDSQEANNQVENMENLTKYLNDARKEIENLNAKLQEMKANTIIFQSKEQEYKMKISNLEKEITKFSENEKENNLKIAENKMELHNELSSKETEITVLKKEMESLKQSLDTFENERKTSTNVKLENLQSQNKKLIEKVENLTQRANNAENELLKVEAYKLEIQDLNQREALLQKEIKELHEIKSTDLKLSEEKIQELSKENTDLKESLNKDRKELENQITSLREDAKKGLLSLEPKIREKLHNEYLQREEQLKQEFTSKIEEIASNNSSIRQVQLDSFQKDDLIKKTTEELDIVRSELSKKLEDYTKLEKNHLELIDDCTKLRNTISTFEKDKIALDAYEEKVSRLEAHITTLQDELKGLEEKLKDKENENIKLCKENYKLQQSLGQTGEKLKILEVKDEAIDLDSSENKLLELKLQQLEEEQNSLLSEFETERKMFNDLVEDHKELKEKERDIEILTESLKSCHDEIKQLKINLSIEMEKNIEINDEKLHFEQEVVQLREQIRLFEEKDECIDLNKSECGILELKLQKLEEDNNKLLESFALERKSFAKDLDALRKDLKTEGESESDEDDLEHKLNEVRIFSESREKEIINLSKEILTLHQQNSSLSEQNRLHEEKLETIQMESTESKLLEIKVQKLEEEREKMFEEFEKERKMFEDLLENSKELQEKEAVIEELEKTIRNNRIKTTDLEENLAGEKKINVHLAQDKLALEKQISKLVEQIRIFEERDEAINMDKTECGILELKLQKLENDNRNLLETFELERAAFKKTYEESSKNIHKIHELQEENSKLKELVEIGKKEIGELGTQIIHHKTQLDGAISKKNELLAQIKCMEDEIQTLKNALHVEERKNKETINKLNEITSHNLKLEKEMKEKDKEVSELSKNIQNLSGVIEKQTTEFNNLLSRTQQLDQNLEKMRTDGSEAIKKEKDHQNELMSKNEVLQRELLEKTAELANLNGNLTELEKLYLEEKKYKADKIQERVAEMKILEESCKNLEQDKQSSSEEKSLLESRLKEIETDMRDKNTQMKIEEQEKYILQEERDGLLAEIDSLRTNLTELSKENGNLRAELSPKHNALAKLDQLEIENELLKAENGKGKDEMSELSVRLQQISSDNQHMVEENQNLMHENEELKIKLEYLESEKQGFDQVRTKLKEDSIELSKSLEEIKQQLDTTRKENIELGKAKNASNVSSPDIAKIQQDFYEIKGKCDNLFVENKNLKEEYSKLEEKCNNFGKIKAKLEAQISELETHYNEIQHEKQLLQDEIQELKTSPLNCHSSQLDQLDILRKEQALNEVGGEKNDHSKEIEILRDKLTKYKSLDLTNKSSIDFYENELQKLKNQNEKLNRRLDETLVTLGHCAELSTSTEVEYLRNVLFNYMMGKESLVLARVIAAVCKFDAQQTETILQKEQQRQTLLGHLGLI
ncbi:hypothetical protein JTB14_016013 [Gonioctena quinquepunctata]|nr:hypothetical protein JTB14_016013 [Gonioctena quinquepunctata]